MILDRRQFLAGGAALIAFSSRAALPVPAGNRLGFDIMRKGWKLGTHVLTFDRAGTMLTVQVVVDLVFRIGPIPLYRYSHRATERWEDDQIVSIECHTDDNGEPYQVSGHREAAGLVVQGTKSGRYVAPPNAVPATHWNRRELEGPWINTQDGRIMRPRVTPLGIATIALVGGRSLSARHYQLNGDVQLDIYYDDRGWAGLSFVKSGTPIRYERQS